MGLMKSAVPKDANSVSLPLTPSVLAIAVTTNASIASSTTITFNAATTLIEVNAVSQGVYMKWGSTASSTLFDEYIQAGSTRHYVIPNDATGAKYTTAQFIQQAATGTLIVIEK